MRCRLPTGALAACASVGPIWQIAPASNEVFAMSRGFCLRRLLGVCLSKELQNIREEVENNEKVGKATGPMSIVDHAVPHDLMS